MSDTPSAEDLESAASGGNPEAQLKFAEFCEERGDEVAAFGWFGAAACFGLPVAQFKLAEMFARGLSPEQIALAQGPGANMYGVGEHATTSDDAAIRWYTKAANQGLPAAQFQLAVMIVNADPEKAMVWFKKAGEQDYVPAQSELGQRYLNGIGVAADDQQAMHWFKRAALLGNPRAQKYVGYFYFEGKGVPKDDVQAYAWWMLWAAGGSNDAKHDFHILRERMSADQIEQGYAMSQRLSQAIAKGKQWAGTCDQS